MRFFFSLFFTLEYFKWTSQSHLQWATRNPEIEEKDCAYVFPDPDLMPSLIDAYFLQFNSFLPLLHRPTFEKSVAEGLHFSDSKFGATLLLVCAHGSRYSDDPRVLADGSDNPRSAGWRWFEQVNVFRTTLYKRTSLYELQMHAVRLLFSSVLFGPILLVSWHLSSMSSFPILVKHLKEFGLKSAWHCDYRKM